MGKLSAQAKKLKEGILKEYDISDEAGLVILQTALEAYDQMNAAQKIINKQGLTVFGARGQLAAHPLFSVVRDSRAQFLMALKHLNLDIEVPREGPGRPPGR